MTGSNKSFKLIAMKESFSEIELRKLDLNLLLVFSAVMREGSVGRAAKRLFLGPSAISMALARLRDTLGDQLFVRDGNGMVPTPRAALLWSEIEPALTRIEAATRGVEFEPETAEAVFTLGAPDDLEFVLIPRLMERLAKDAPGVRLVVQPMDFRNMFDRLDDGGVDLGLSALPSRGAQSRHRVRSICREHFSAVHDPERIALPNPLTLERFAETPQILVSIRGDFSGPIDAVLADLDTARTVIGTVARFATIPFVLRRRPVLACVPATAASYMAAEFDLIEQSLPFPSPQFELGLAWHQRTDSDPAHQWFRELVEAELHNLIAQ